MTLASRPYDLEMRQRPDAGLSRFSGFQEWQRWRRYLTPKRRDAALYTLNRKDRLFEYRARNHNQRIAK